MFFPPRLPLLLLLVVLVHLKMLLLQPSRSWLFRLTYAEEALAVLLSLALDRAPWCVCTCLRVRVLCWQVV
uniref:Putative secreted protein n=1 Tax=Anopheles darlingi TaxID=43151 RepID=A0A2M4DSH1_ANODA